MHHDGACILFADNVGWGRDDVTPNTKTHPSSTTLTLASPARRLPTAVKRPAKTAVRTPAMATSSAVLPSRFFGYFQAI